MNLYTTEGGVWSGCSDPGDGYCVVFISDVDPIEMLDRMRAAAKEQGDAYEHETFLESQKDGIGFRIPDKHRFEQEFGEKRFDLVFHLDEGSKDRLFSPEQLEEILAERQRKAEEIFHQRRKYKLTLALKRLHPNAIAVALPQLGIEDTGTRGVFFDSDKREVLKIAETMPELIEELYGRRP